MNTLKVEELRIGNYLQNESNIQFTVTPNTIESLWESPRKWCNPIPITDEILLKFGAKVFPEMGEGYYKLGVYEMFLNKYGVLEFFLTQFGYSCIRAESVHELQNIYYIVTGNELTFKE